MKFIWSTSKTLWDAANIYPSRSAALDAAARAHPGEPIYVGSVRPERPDARGVAETILPGLLRVIVQSTIHTDHDELIENVDADHSAFQRRLSDFLIGELNRPEWDLECSAVHNVTKNVPTMKDEPVKGAVDPNVAELAGLDDSEEQEPDFDEDAGAA